MQSPPVGESRVSWTKRQEYFALKYTVIIVLLIVFIWWLVHQVNKQDKSPGVLLEKLNELIR